MFRQICHPPQNNKKKKMKERRKKKNMKTKIVGIFVCMLLIAAVVLPAAGTIDKREIFDNKSSMKFVPGEFIVKLKQDRTFSSPALIALNEKHQVYALEKVFNNAVETILDNIYLLHVPMGSDILAIVQEYASCPNVVYAEPNGRVYPCSIPNDANFSIQWYLHNTGQMIWNNTSGIPDADIDAPEAWDIETGSPDVVIAIVDSGIDYTHPELSNKIWNNTDEIPGNGIDDDNNGYIDDIKGWDFYYNESDIKDWYGHGTMCSGAAAASTNNGIGIAGVAWNCKIMPVGIFNETGWCYWSEIAPGIKYAADNGADIISMSWGATSVPKIIKDAVNYAYGRGVFLCAAVHNYNTSQKFYPAAFDNVTAVAATNQNDCRCTEIDWWPGGGSNYGDWVDIAAPGSLTYTLMPTYFVYYNTWYNTLTGKNFSQNYDIWPGGTSFSCPLVAGVAALLLSKDPSLTPDQVKALLCGNVDPYNSTEYIGTGRLNARKALAALNQPPAPPTITGPAKGKIKVATEYNFTTTDPDGDEVSYFIDWDDGANSSWVGPYPSGDLIPISHTWSKKGTYTIKAKAKDIYGNESDWGTLSVTMPCSYNIPFQPFWERLFERFPHIFPILRHLLGY
jgi:subtilisin family serine protease